MSKKHECDRARRSKSCNAALRLVWRDCPRDSRGRRMGLVLADMHLLGVVILARFLVSELLHAAYALMHADLIS